ncbi:MAG: hypothetical protein U0353_23770 [Sandaracinus sp.]
MPTASTLLAEELFASGDPGFLAALYDVQVPRGTEQVKGWGGKPYDLPTRFARKPQKAHPLGIFAKRWLEDPRPWARDQLRQYIADGCDRPGHRTLVKRLYKGVEDRGDQELLALFVVSFDRLRRMRVRTRKVYDWSTRRVVESQRIEDFKPRTPGVLHFSQRTRNYLQARVARHVRMLGTHDPAAYRRTVLEALCRYEDKDFPAGHALPRMRSLVSLLFAHSDVFFRVGRRIDLASGKTLADLAPAPHHAAAWKVASAELFDALLRARSLFVRRQLVRWLERDFVAELGTLDVSRVRGLLLSPHADLQLFGARLLENAPGVENLLLEEWLSLLQIDNAEVLPLIVQKMSASVTPARASLEQCVALARHEAHAPAMLGAEWAETKTITTKVELEAALPIVDAGVREARERGLAWITPAVVRDELGLDAHMRELLDARHADVRARAFALLTETPRFRDSIVLWAALAESPHADARTFLLSLLARRRTALEGTQLGDRSLHHLWATTILEVNRGSRAKQRALTQLGERLESQPQQADVLMPLLAFALRSVRETERRGALSALVRAAMRQPEVRDAITRHAPEIHIQGVHPAPSSSHGAS